MTPAAARFVILQTLGVSLFAAGWIVGWITHLIDADQSYLTWVILALLCVALGLVALGRDRDAIWLGGHLFNIGLLGTLIGFVIAFSGVEIGQGFESDSAAAEQLTHGVLTALGTTVFGLVANIWVSLNVRLVCGEEG